jgi:hypothetical protein
MLASVSNASVEIEQIIKQQVQEETAKLMAIFREEQMQLHKEVDENEGDFISISTPTSKLLKSISSRSGADPVADSTELCNFIEFIEKNKRFDNHWRNKTLEEIFPVLNENSRLMNAAVTAKATFILELR